MAQLPKPLSQKSIQRMLTGWKPAVVDKLHAYYGAFANFYGCLSVGEAWEIYKRYDNGIKKKEFYEFSSIARREDLPYYILEIDEVYSDEKRSLEERIIVNKSLVGEGYNRFFFLVNLENVIYENQVGFYLPEDILQYTAYDGIDENEYWKEFSDFINGIKTSSGVTIGDSKELTNYDKFELKYYKSEAKKKKIIEDAQSHSLGERLLEKYKRSFHMGWNDPKSVFMDMEENDIELSEFDKKRVENLYIKIYNTSNLWCYRGLNTSRVVKVVPTVDGVKLFAGTDFLETLQRTDLSEEEKKQINILKKFLDEAGINVEGLDD